MMEPFAKCGIWCNLSNPQVNACLFFGNSPRPKTVHEDTEAIVFTRFVMRASDFDHIEVESFHYTTNACPGFDKAPAFMPVLFHGEFFTTIYSRYAPLTPRLYSR